MRRCVTVVMVLSACLAACGDNRPAPPEPAPDAGPFQTAPHAPMPIVLPHTATVLSAVHLVTLEFSDYTAPVDLAAFGDALVASSWYRSIGAEYAISSGTAELIEIGPAPASLSRADIVDRIKALIAGGQVPRPAAAANQVLYLIYVPPAVARGSGLTARGYHEMLTLPDGVRAPIAVVPDDGDGAAAMTMRAAHQLINAVTDPYIPPKDGYYADPPRTDPWTLVRGELGDLCEGEEPFIEDGFAFPRVYSNRAAASSTPPCLPVLPGDSWSEVTAEPSQIQMVAAGGSVRFRLTGWSTSPLPDWQIRVQAADFSQLSQDEMRPQLSSDTINNNTTVTLMLHAPFEASRGTTGGVYLLSGKNQHPWAVGFVVQ